ncbi:MAG: ABC transporter permease [Clostridia bacterium]
MKRGFYPKLALTGISKNRKTYVPYILTCAGMIMMFYIISFLSKNDTIAAMPGGGTIQAMLSMGCGVMIVFALIFLFYTNSFLIRRRKKEFGLYNILGMGKGNLARILFWESVIIAAISYAGGLLCGILFSKIAELVMTRILHGDVSFHFSVDGAILLQTVALFAGIFVLILLNALRQIRASKPVELLRSDAVGEKPPKANWILAFLGAAILASAYYLSVSIENPISALVWFFVAVIMVIVATYFLFIAGSVVYCKLLQKNKRYYYKTNHFVSVSSMIYRMKRNGAGLASICILSTMVLVMLSTTMCLYIGAEDMLRSRYPRNIVVDTYSLDEESVNAVHGAIEDALAASGEQAENLLHYRYLEAAAYVAEDHVVFDKANLSQFSLSLYSDTWQLFVVPLEDYNRLMGKNETLADNEILLYCTKTDYAYDTITLADLAPRTVKKVVPEFVDNGIDSMQVIPSMFLFVPDFSALDGVWEQHVKSEKNASLRHDYYAFDLNCDAEKQIAIGEKIYQSIRAFQIADNHFPHMKMDCAEKDRADFYALSGGLFFLGTLLGIVFICAAVLIMYYKQITEGYEDQCRFEIMQKVGMTKTEIRKSINSQVLTVFFLPLLTAGVHLVFAFPMISKMLRLFSLTDTKLFVLVMIGSYLVFAFFYVAVYLLTSREYFSIVSGGKKK